MYVNLYIVTNDVNNKVYIGQTSETLKRRWRNHINDAMYKDGNTNKFHNALITIGISHFNIRLIGQFDVSVIDEKEIEYIAKYDSFKNGYNSTLGGGLGIRIPIETREHIFNLYKNGYSRADISREVGCGVTKVTDILMEYDIMPDFERNEPVSIVMYDKEFNIQKVFNSKKEAYEFIINNENPRCNKQGFYGHIKKAFDTGCIRYGHHWQLASDLIHEDKIFKTKFDKEAYIQGKQVYKPEGEQYWIIDKRPKKHKITKNIKDTNKTSNLIDKNIKHQRKSKKPDKEVLKDLLNVKSYEDIGRMYNVTGKTVRKWADSYSLVTSRQIDKSGVTCVELNIHFNTFKEAAEYLIQNSYYNTFNVNKLAYNISKAKKKHIKYLKFTWK